MRKLAGLAALALMLVPAAASAQAVSISVQVAATATGANAGNLSFGTLAPGGSLTITPGHTNGATTIGAVQITHNGNFSIGTGSNTATLTRDGGTETLSVTLSCQYRDAASAGAALAPTDGGAVNCNAVPNWASGGNTNVFLQVGGALTVGGAAVSGTYNGSVTFTVAAL